MKHIKVLGTGCAGCKTTIEMIRHQAEVDGVDIRLEKVDELQEIMAYSVLSTPAVVIDGEIVHTGGIPTKDKIQSWLL